MINSVTLIGRLTKDPVLRKTQNGIANVSFILAVDRKYKQENQPTADFVNCVAWKKTAELICGYMSKGSMMGVEGRIQTRTYDDQAGKKIYVTEVVAESISFLDYKKSEQQDVPETDRDSDDSSLKILDDDLPF